MTLQEQLAADLAVFIDAQGFSRSTILQGQDVLADHVSDSAQALDEWRKRTQEPPGVGVRLLTLLVGESDLKRPLAEDVLDVDGVEWTVLSTSVEYGLLTLHLYRHES